jgi:hypothetical protein
MKKLLLIAVPLTALTTACVPAPYRVRTAPLITRWDNVTMLAAGTPVQVLLMHGRLARGQVVFADWATLRLSAASGVEDIAAADVRRVDRFEVPKASATLREGAKGAALVAGITGVIGILKGRTPPAWQFLAAGLVGSYTSMCVARPVRGPITIYIAPPSHPSSFFFIASSRLGGVESAIFDAGGRR